MRLTSVMPILMRHLSMELTSVGLISEKHASIELASARLTLCGLISMELISVGVILSMPFWLRQISREQTSPVVKIYGISAWNLELKGAIQSDLIITPDNEPIITVDNLEVAQFIYLLINNEKLRDVIDTITSKVVLILGRFTPEREVVLYALKEELRKRNYLPILFKFEKPNSRNTTETITLLARMARFVIADITDAKSIAQELGAIVPHIPSVPVQPLLEYSQNEYGMFESMRDYHWVLETYYYKSISEVLASINEKVISPAEAKVREILEKRTSLYQKA